MANTLLTSDVITKESIRLLAEKLTFVRNINRQYDNSFAKNGAKIGDSLRIRKPARYSVRTGANLGVQDFKQTQTSLQVSNQTGVDVSFTSAELSLSLDDFSKNVLEPAVSRIAADIEEKVIAIAAAGTGAAVAAAGTGITFKDFLKAGAYLDNNSAPLADRSSFAAPLTQVEIIDALKTLQNDTKQISQQYIEGKMGMAAGYTWYSNNKLPTLALPATDIAGAIVANMGPADFDTKTIACNNFTAGEVIAKGTPVTIAGVYAVNYETGATLPYLKQWITTTDVTVAAGGLASLILSEGIRPTGNDKNCSAYPQAAAVTSIIGGTAGETKQLNLAVAKDFMTFATADLLLPGGVDMASRQNYEGISMRLVRQYDINKDAMPCRLDVLWGAAVLRPELGVSVIG